MKNYTWEKNNTEKNNFIARIMGIIGEEISSHWFSNSNCEFENCGRPTIYWNEGGTKNQATLDFLIKERNSEKEEYYIVEQKNFFAFRNGKLRTINKSLDFINNFQSWTDYKSKSTPAWRIFNQLEKFKYKVKTKSVREINKLKGAILIWSDVNENESNEFKTLYGYQDVIGLTRMVEDLNRWNDKNWSEYIGERAEWLSELFNLLKKY